MTRTHFKKIQGYSVYCCDVNRSILRDEIEFNMSNFEYKDFSEFRKKCNNFINAFSASAQIGNKTTIVLDSNILMSIRDRKDHKCYLPIATAAFVFFDFLKTNYNVKIAIVPTIFYEYIKKKMITSRFEYEKNIYSLLSDLKYIGLPVALVGVDDFKSAKCVLKKIEHDEKQIKKALSYISSRDWKTEIKQGSWIRIPQSIAFESVPKINLKYFSKGYVRHVLSCNIEKRIIESNNYDKNIKKFRLNRTVRPFYKILNNDEKSSLKGHGDLELFSICDLKSQFAEGYEETIFALTIDKDLCDVLNERATINASVCLNLGAENFDKNTVKFENFLNEVAQRDRKMNKMADEYFAAFRIYLEETLFPMMDRNDNGKLS